MVHLANGFEYYAYVLIYVADCIEARSFDCEAPV
jgi:hypothetical protein